MDMNTNLEKAIDYVSYLEEKVRELELEQSNNTSRKKIMAAWGYNGNYYYDGASSLSRCCETGVEEWCEASLPEVKARLLENEVMIIIHCEKRKGIMNKILPQLENLHLSVISSSVGFTLTLCLLHGIEARERELDRVPTKNTRLARLSSQKMSSRLGQSSFKHGNLDSFRKWQESSNVSKRVN